MKSDIEIARSIELTKIKQIARETGIPVEHISNYGRYIAKVDENQIDEEKVQKNNLILVTAITPTKAGIGKTTVSIGLALGLNKIGKKAIVALREPSLGPCFGMKGGAAGGGYAQFSGTSFAAPFATGAAALLMEWGIVRGNDPYLYGEKVKAYMRRGARELPGFDVYPNPQVGYGALCVRDSLPI